MSEKETAERSLIPELQERRSQFRSIKKTTEELTAGLTHQQFNWRPTSEEWSVAQCLSHLNVAGFLILRRVEEAIEEARDQGPRSEGPFEYSLVGRSFVRLMEPSSWMRVSSPSSFVPAPEHSREVVIPRFLELQDDLVASVEAANGLDLRRIKVRSPVSRLLRFSLGIWFAAVEAHERRHMEQAQRIRSHPRFP